MNNKYNELYSYLSNVGVLTKDDYKRLVSLYGSTTVHMVIEQIIDNDNTTIGKFGIYIDNLLLNETFFPDMSILNIYINDLGGLPRLSNMENSKYSLEVYQIITSLKELFSHLKGNYVKKDGGLYASISEEVLFYLNEYENRDKEIYKVIKDMHDRFIVLRNKIVEGNIRLVISAMKPYYKSEDTFVELLQCGNIGLMRAVEKYNPNFGTSFSTYAYYWIKQAYRTALKFELQTGAKVSYDSIQHSFNRLKVFDELVGELGRYPTRDEVAEKMGVSIKKLDEIESVLQFNISLNSKISLSQDDDSDIELIDFYHVSDVNVEEEVCFKDLRPELMQLLDKCLNERQKFIILNRFGFLGDELTYEQLGKIFGITKQRVEQEQSRSLKKLRSKVNDNLIDFLR